MPEKGPRKCRACGAVGHRADSVECPKKGEKGAKRKAITRRHPKPPAKPERKPGAFAQEMAALTATFEALMPLDILTRQRVLRYVCERVGIDPAKLAA